MNEKDCPSPKNCREVIEAACQIESTQEDIAQLKTDIRRIFDKMESNARWLLGIILTLGAQTAGIIAGILIAINKP